MTTVAINHITLRDQYVGHCPHPACSQNPWFCCTWNDFKDWRYMLVYDINCNEIDNVDHNKNIMT